MTSSIASFMALSFGGILTAGYLVWQHYNRNNKDLVCPLDHDCSKVTESEWSHVFYFRNETLGLLFYISMLIAVSVAFFIPSTSSFLFLLIKIATGTGFLFSLFLIGVQLYKIKDYCFYCLISAILSSFLFLNSLFL